MKEVLDIFLWIGLGFLAYFVYYIYHYKISDLKIDVETHIPFHTALFEKKKIHKLDLSFSRYFDDVNLYHCIRIYKDTYSTIIVEESYVLSDMIKRYEFRVRNHEGISKLISQSDKYKLKNIKNIMFIQQADSKLAKIFSIGLNDPITRIESLIFDQNDYVIAIIVRYFPSEYVEFESEIRNA